MRSAPQPRRPSSSLLQGTQADVRNSIAYHGLDVRLAAKHKAVNRVPERGIGHPIDPRQQGATSPCDRQVDNSETALMPAWMRRLQMALIRCASLFFTLLPLCAVSMSASAQPD